MTAHLLPDTGALLADGQYQRAGRSRSTSSLQAAAHLLWLLKHCRPLAASHHVLQEFLEGLRGLIEAPAGTVAGVKTARKASFAACQLLVLPQCSCRAQACGCRWAFKLDGRRQSCWLCSARRQPKTLYRALRLVNTAAAGAWPGCHLMDPEPAAGSGSHSSDICWWQQVTHLDDVRAGITA